MDAYALEVASPGSVPGGSRGLQRSTRLLGLLLDRLLVEADESDRVGEGGEGDTYSTLVGARHPHGAIRAPSSGEGVRLVAAWCNLAATFLSAVEASFAVTKSQGFVIAMPDVMQLVFEVATKSAERGQWELLQRIRASLRRFFICCEK